VVLNYTEKNIPVYLIGFGSEKHFHDHSLFFTIYLIHIYTQIHVPNTLECNNCHQCYY